MQQISFDASEKREKTEIFLCFQEVSKEISCMEWVNDSYKPIRNNCVTLATSVQSDFANWHYISNGMWSLETSLAQAIRLIFDLITFIVLVTKEPTKLSGELPPEENCPPVRVGVWIKVRVSFRVGGNQTIAPKENSPPPPSAVRVRVWLRVSFWVEGNFPQAQLS